MEVRGDIGGSGNFVSARAPCQQFAVSAPHQFFGGEPAQALYKAALNLPDVQRRVQRIPDVVQDVHAQQFVLARQGVDGHLAAGRAIGEVVEGAATQGSTVVVDFGCGIKAVTPQLHPLAVSVLHRLRKAAHLLGCAYLGVHEHQLMGRAVIGFGNALCQVLAHLQSGAFCCATIQIGATGCCGGAGIGDLVGIGAADAHLVHTQPQHLGDDGTHLGVQALAHFGAAMVDLYAAIGVDRHQSTRLVELGGGETDAKLHRRDGDTALDDRVLGIESTDLFAAFSVVAVCRQLGHEARQDVVFHRHAIGRGVARCIAIQVA